MNNEIESNIYLTEEVEKEIWENCIVVFDTSAILSLYDYSDVFRQKFIVNVLNKFKGKLFITGFSEFEFFKNRKLKIDNPINQKIIPFENTELKKLKDPIIEFSKFLKEIKELVKSEDYPPFIPPAEFEKTDFALENLQKHLDELQKNILNLLKIQKDKIKSLKENDTIFDSIKDLFEVTDNYSHSQIMKLIKNEGEFRHRNKIAPGYMDNPSISSSSKKKGIQIYADFIIWKQIIDLSNEKKKNVLLITNDLKEDWCVKTPKKKTRISHPNFDLIREFKDYTNNKFWMYSMSDILYFSNKYLNTDFSKDEIQKVDEHVIDNDLVEIKCNVCNSHNKFNNNDLNIDFSAQYSSEENMGTEIQYVSVSDMFCHNCLFDLSLELNIWEYPVGVLNFKSEKVIGGTLISIYDYTENFFDSLQDIS